jgi:hypothetical protein
MEISRMLNVSSSAVVKTIKDNDETGSHEALMAVLMRASLIIVLDGFCDDPELPLLKRIL